MNLAERIDAEINPDSGFIGHGWCSREKAQKLADIITEASPEVCVELGVFGGSSLIPQALALADNGHGTIYGVDDWDNATAMAGMGAAEHIAWWGKVDMHTAYWRCCRDVLRLGVEQHVCLYRETSDQAAVRFGKDTIDVIHIDGNHGPAQSCRDVTGWLPLVRPGGWIVFDDVDWSEGEHNTTRMAGEYLLGFCDFDERIGGCVFMRKR